MGIKIVGDSLPSYVLYMYEGRIPFSYSSKFKIKSSK